MKKQLLLALTLFVGLSLFGQTTVELLDNTEYGPANSFQVKVTSLIPDNYQAKAGDTIKVDIVGTSDYDISNIKMAIADTRAEVSYWKELSAWNVLDSVSVTSDINYSGVLVLNEDAAGAGSSFCQLVFEIVSEPAKTAASAKVTFTLSTFEISVPAEQDSVPSNEETVVKLADNTQYGPANSFQVKEARLIPSDYQAKAGDTIKVDIVGTSDYDISNIKMAIADTRAEVSWWKELSAWNVLDSVSVTSDINYSGVLVLNEDAAGAGSAFCQLVFEIVSEPAKTAASADVTFTLSTFEISIIPADQSAAITLNKVANPEVVSTTVYSINGVNLGLLKAYEDLNDGIYIFVKKYNDGSIKTSKVMKK